MKRETPKYSVIIPVYNRPDEVAELLDSLSKQRLKNFEVIIVEDGSTEDCKDIVKNFEDELTISYHFKENTGPGDSRNFGVEKATGEYVIFFDSDCIIPPQYFTIVTESLDQKPLDCFGGPDNAHESFSDLQKAINYSMTSFFTTGGIRGQKKQLDKFQPRSFNMGIRKEVMQEVGGFGHIHPGEDPDLSYRIMAGGYSTGLIHDAFVYHKRRIDWEKFGLQVYKFGVARVILNQWHPDSKKWVYWLPSLFLSGSAAVILLSLWQAAFLFFLLLYAVILFADAHAKTQSVSIAWRSIIAAFVQLWGYGYGFLKAYYRINLLKKSPEKAFPEMFFGDIE